MPPVRHVRRHETNMSWLFVDGEEVYQLKTPLRFPYLDFSTLARREAACRAELTLNRRLAPNVYQAVMPLLRSSHGLAIGGPGEIVDWLVVMRRLDDRQTLEYALETGGLATWQLDRLASTLTEFYRHAGAILVSRETHLRSWYRSLAYNKSVLLDPRLALPAGLVRMVDRAQRRLFAPRAVLMAPRVPHRRIVERHGDLRPANILLGDPVKIIACLGFNR